MTIREDNNTRQSVDQFIVEQIESVPHLEALLLLWKAWPRSWSLLEMTKSLYLAAGVTQDILDDLTRRGLLAKSGTGTNEWQYASEPDRDLLINQVDKTYRAELIRISRLIHSKRSTPIQEFARAFRFKKD
jgi:hypothetical protein